MTRTTNPSTLPTATRISVCGLLIAAVGILIQYLALPELFPAVPPGPIVLTAVAIVVALGARWWWTPLIGGAAALMITIGGLLSGNLVDNLTALWPATGAVVMLLGLAGALAAGAVAIARHRRTA